MKDIIFAELPSVNTFKGRIQAHIALNNKLEGMKQAIRTASTLQGAVDILIEKFGCEDLLSIIQVIKEVFQINQSEIEKLL